MYWMYASKVWTHGCKSLFSNALLLQAMIWIWITKVEFIIERFWSHIVNILCGHYLIDIYVVETDDKPCGLVIICIVFGQVISYWGGAAKFRTIILKKSTNIYLIIFYIRGNYWRICVNNWDRYRFCILMIAIELKL